MTERRTAAVDLIEASVTLGGERVLERLTLTAPRQSVTCVTGPSGCGKTTLLRLLAGLIEPTEGQVIRRADRIGVVFQEPRLLPWLSARDNVVIGFQGSDLSRAAQRRQAEDLLALTGLGSSAARLFPDALSGGMASRVAFARALATEPDLLLCDEPFAALDPDRRLAMQDLLLERVAQTRAAAVFVTHDQAEATRLAHRIYHYVPDERSFRQAFPAEAMND
ncbi:MAG: ATP-binding cassette domain-containing protein [Pseudomonadota bacterium]